MAITIRSEKGSALTYSEMDSNFLQLRNVINEANDNGLLISQLQDLSTTLSTTINDLQNDTLQISQNLNDLESKSQSRINLGVYSKSESDSKYFQISNNLSELQNIDAFLQSIGVKSNAKRDIFISDDMPNPSLGIQGDLWYEYGVIVSNNI